MSSSAFYYHSYGIYGICPTIPAIQAFLRRNCSAWKNNTVQLQSLTSTVCGQYCCLFTLYMDRGLTPKKFIGFFIAVIAEWQVNKIFTSVLGPLRKELRGGRYSHNIHQSFYTIKLIIIVNSIIDLNGGSHWLRISDRSKGEVIVKELSVAAKDVPHTFHFRNPYAWILKAQRRTG